MLFQSETYLVNTVHVSFYYKLLVLSELQVVNRKGSGYGLAADIWSLGCTVLEMLTRKLPYAHLEGVCIFLKPSVCSLVKIVLNVIFWICIG